MTTAVERGGPSSLVPFIFLFAVLLPSPASPELNYLIGAAYVAAALGMLGLHARGSLDAAVLAAWVLLIASWILALVANLDRIETTTATLREIYKIVVYPFLIAFAVSIAAKHRIADSRFRSVLLFALLVQFALVAVAASGFESALSTVYDTSKLSAGTALGERVRYTGSFDNPNYLGLFACMVVAAVLAEGLHTSRQVLMLVAGVFLVLLTGSRTALLAVGLLLAVKYPLRTALATVVALSTLVGTLTLSPDAWGRLAVLGSGWNVLEDYSVAERLSLLGEAGVLISQRLAFGYFESPIDITDNFYTLMLLRYGITFCLTAGFFMIVAVVKLFGTRCLSRSTVLAVVPAVVFSTTGAFLDNPRMFSVTLLVAVWIISRDRDRDHVVS